MTFQDLKTHPHAKTFLFGLVLLLQVAVLSGMTVKKMIPVWRGKRVVFQPTPRDPMDLFRGQYVRLNFDFSRVRTPPDLVPANPDAFAGVSGAAAGEPDPGARVRFEPPLDAETWRRGRTAYLLLAGGDAEGKGWRPARVGFAPADPAPGEVQLRVKVGWWSQGSELHLDLPFDAYYVTEGDGPRIEEAMRLARRGRPEEAPPVKVEVYPDDSGAATMTALFVGSERY